MLFSTSHATQRGTGSQTACEVDRGYDRAAVSTERRPRLMLVDDDASRRIEAVAALSGRFDVVPVGEEDDALRVARTRRPDVVLVSLSRRHPDVGLRLCRTLHTDVRPV